jgi:hypothetical protein
MIAAIVPPLQVLVKVDRNPLLASKTLVLLSV